MKKLQESRSAVFAAEQKVADYLYQNPDFFERHIYLLHSLSIPHLTGASASLIERQVKVLREENRHLNQKLNEMIEVAKENDQRINRMQKLTLRLIEASSLQEAIRALERTLHKDFQADFVRICLIPFSNAAAVQNLPNLVGENDPGLGVFANLFSTGQPLCGRLRRSQLQYLFGNHAHEVRSAALIPCGPPQLKAMVAIGSTEIDRFQPGMGTLFLIHLGELVTRMIQRYAEQAAEHPG